MHRLDMYASRRVDVHATVAFHFILSGAHHATTYTPVFALPQHSELSTEAIISIVGVAVTVIIPITGLLLRPVVSRILSKCWIQNTITTEDTDLAWNAAPRNDRNSAWQYRRKTDYMKLRPISLGGVSTSREECVWSVSLRSSRVSILHQQSLFSGAHL
ncbi:uncharacterized protein J3D65DRAFT_641362 [Phyllosticta citribraziliensis]|uniref:Uncharacterized protein n=1 Tax=Phyllosticta citribraziliensis TaxID=989973 RepID=A0ABR1L3M0_9PEZI